MRTEEQLYMEGERGGSCVSFNGAVCFEVSL